VAVERRPVAGVLAVAFVEGEAVLSEALAHETGVCVGSVGDEECAHDGNGTGVQVAMKTFFSSV
jgi:hypothetical protein